jgi:DNA-binding response OmpR family regulator
MAGFLRQQDALSAEPRRPGRHCILYIDGDASNVEVMRDIVAGEGVDLITCPSGEFGIELAHSCRPDLIILDLALPQASGSEVIASLRESIATYRIPIVALTYAECNYVSGLSMYCRRPIQVPEFLAMLRELLGRAPGVKRAYSGGGMGSAQPPRPITPRAPPPQS